MVNFSSSSFVDNVIGAFDVVVVGLVVGAVVGCIDGLVAGLVVGAFVGASCLQKQRITSALSQEEATFALLNHIS
jgi:outer membrane lipoprotein SlyB